MKHIVTASMIAATLTACTTLGDVEKQALHDRAVADARSAPKELHLAYLHCYGLNRYAKAKCHGLIGQGARRREANSWEYILPFEYEAERLGFAQFLRDRGKPCASVTESPRFYEDRGGYEVPCANGGRYLMRFDHGKREWSVAD